jgi:SAM-dependent methyltransferase
MDLDQALLLSQGFQTQTALGEREELYRGILETPPGAVVEIGSASGGTTIVLIAAAEQVGKKVISVDPYPEEIEEVANDYPKGLMSALKKEFYKNILAGNKYGAIQYNCDLTDCIDQIPEVSVAFIDGCHELECVYTGFKMIFPRIVPGGRLYIHDINWTIGQLSKSTKGGVCNSKFLMSNDRFKDISIVSTMLCGTKL